MRTLIFSRNTSLILFALTFSICIGAQTAVVAQDISQQEIYVSNISKLLQSKVPGLDIQVQKGASSDTTRIDSNSRKVMVRGYQIRSRELAYNNNDSAMVKKMTVDSKMRVLVLESADPMPGSNPPTIRPASDIPISNVEQLIEGKVPKRPRKAK